MSTTPAFAGLPAASAYPKGYVYATPSGHHIRLGYSSNWFGPLPLDSAQRIHRAIRGQCLAAEMRAPWYRNWLQRELEAQATWRLDTEEPPSEGPTLEEAQRRMDEAHARRVALTLVPMLLPQQPEPMLLPQQLEPEPEPPVREFEYLGIQTDSLDATCFAVSFEYLGLSGVLLRTTKPHIANAEYPEWAWRVAGHSMELSDLHHLANFAELALPKVYRMSTPKIPELELDWASHPTYQKRLEILS